MTDFVYDGQGNVLSAQRGPLRVQHAYDSLGRRIFSDYGRGVNVSFGYGEVVNECVLPTRRLRLRPTPGLSPRKDASGPTVTFATDM